MLYFNYGSLLLPDVLTSRFSPRQLINHSAVRTTSNKDKKEFSEFNKSKVSVSQNSDSHILKPSENSKQTLGNDKSEKQMQEEVAAGDKNSLPGLAPNLGMSSAALT